MHKHPPYPRGVSRRFSLRRAPHRLRLRLDGITVSLGLPGTGLRLVWRSSWWRILRHSWKLAQWRRRNLG